MYTMRRWNNAILMFFVLFGLCSQFSESTLKLDDKCDTASVNSGCPTNSTCTYRGCSGAICICNRGLMPMSDSYDKCVEIAELGDKCINTNKRCRGNSRCDVSLGCVCQSGYNRYGNLCIPREPLGKRKANIGEKCNETSDCLNNYHLECVMSRCVCEQGFKPPDQSTIDAYPFSPLVCVNDNFKLGKEYDIKEECFTVDPSPPPIINNTSTSTIQGTTTMYSLSPSKLISTTSFQESSIESTITSTIQDNTEMTSFQTPVMSTPYHISSSISSSSQLLNSPTLSSSTSMNKMNSRIHQSTSTVTETLITEQSTQTSVAHISPSSVKEASSVDGVSSSDFHISHIRSSPFQSSQSNGVPSKSVETMTWTQISSTSVENTSVNSRTSLVTSISESFPHSTRTSSSIESLYQSNVLSTIGKTSSYLEMSEHTASSSSSENILLSQMPPSLSKLFVRSSATFSPESSFEQSLMLTRSTTFSLDSSLLTSSSTNQLTHSSSQAQPMPSSSSISPVYSSLSSSIMSSTTKQTSSTSVPPVNSPCDRTDICPDNAACTETSCGRKCLCNDGFAPNKNNNCVQVVTLGQNCGTDKICMDPKSTCEDGKCQCLHGYKPDATITRCKKSTSWFIEFPLLTEECSTFFKECHNAFEQECRNDKCSCREGLRKKTLIEIKKNYKSYKQCLNESATEDSLFGNNCEYYSANEDEPSINDARRRIQIMQGVMIGGGLLVVFLIAGLITMALCIRYKRRIGDMRSETSSIVSLDRCSEGKYSFRIPRPFATPILYAGTGESDTDAMSFQNTAYDSERERLRDEEHKSINGTMARGFNLKSEDIEFKFYEDDKENKDEK